MDKAEIYEIWERFEQSAATEVSIETEGARLYFKKEAAAGKTEIKKEPAVLAETGQHAGDAESGEEVKAPLLGTFYRSPAPGEKPFVEVGDQVKKGDVLALIEAMKLMNELVAPRDGVVREICVEDGGLAEYEQVLMRLA